ncbi:hypothetical protein STEG23_035605, partial [Scotinomys teguina]
DNSKSIYLAFPTMIPLTIQVREPVSDSANFYIYLFQSFILELKKDQQDEFRDLLDLLIKQKTYMFFLSLLFAIEEINRNAHILPNITLGFDVHNVPFIDADIMYIFLKWISGIDKMIPNYNCRKESKSVALITGPSWTVSTLAGELLELYKFPQTPQSVCSESCGPGFRKAHVEGKAICCFDCTPCPENEISNETNMEQCLRCEDNQYANVQRIHCIRKEVTFLSYEDTLGMLLTSLCLCFSALTVSVLGVFVKHRATPIVKANNRTLSYILLVSLILCFLCPLLFLGHPNTATCILQQTVFGVVFTVALSAVLAKTVTVVLAFSVTSPGRRLRWLLISRVPNFIVPFCTLIQLIPFGIWLGTSPPFIDIDTQSEYDDIIILCNKGSVAAFYCVLGYLGFLAVGSFTLAFL